MQIWLPWRGLKGGPKKRCGKALTPRACEKPYFGKGAFAEVINFRILR